MRDTTDPNPCTAPYVRRAITEIYPECTDDGGLETVPAAHAAYVDHHQRQWL
jgi:hypothetical protein